jgi:hypothetical protein
LLDTPQPSVNIWYIPIGLDQKEVVVMEVLVEVGLLVWVMVVLLGTGVERS